jgi:hypothetical protein
MLRAVALSLLLGSIASRAQADWIAPPPLECPPATRPHASHRGSGCEVRFCGQSVMPAGSVDCGAGHTCRDALICFERPGPYDPERPGQPIVRPFEDDGAGDERCTRAEVCMPDEMAGERYEGATPPRPAPPVRGGCASCALAARSPGAVSVLTLALLAGIARRRRRTRPADGRS